jgi:hypothetical protein
MLVVRQHQRRLQRIIRENTRLERIREYAWEVNDTEFYIQMTLPFELSTAVISVPLDLMQFSHFLRSLLSGHFP